jgi:aspartyl-tRNA(Asn)/glutamyl-tRNA(Gln) amidotransferase subunit A
MYILCCAEISNNINRYDGIKFGHRARGFKNIDDLYVKTRTEGFGLETKFAAIMGAMVLSEGHYASYYENAMKIRRLIKESLRFDEYDIIVLPCKISEDPYENLALYSLAALVGLPSVSFMYKGSGIQLIADIKKESLLRTAWEVCIS